MRAATWPGSNAGPTQESPKETSSHTSHQGEHSVCMRDMPWSPSQAQAELENVRL